MKEVWFWDSLEEHGDAIALETEDESVSYARLAAMADSFTSGVKARAFVFLVCENTVAAVAAYVGFLRRRAVPVLLSAEIDPGLFDELKLRYAPQYICCPDGFLPGEGVAHLGSCKLLSSGMEAPRMDEQLAIMLTTSGSTGSPKFVRQSYRNIQSNTESIAAYLDIRPDDRAITTLPMNYTYGLSILQSHLFAGARIILTEKTLFERGFWDFFRSKGATTFGAVPYTYQMLDRLRFLRMDLPSLRYITQAGGRLGEELHRKFAVGMREKGKALIVMYGATEATARMSYVPADHAVEKAGSIGIAIPGGRFELIDTDGSAIKESGKVGELVYYGPNVTFGYAECREDLARGDERGGRLETGDMAMRDDDGYYFVVGRKKRFLKIFGNRVNLVEIEDLLAKGGFECACVGEDDHMRIYTTCADCAAVVQYISEKTGLNRAAFTAIHIDQIPHNNAGKVLYSELP